MHWRNAVDDAGNADRVVGPAPEFAVDGDAAGDGAVDIDELVG